MWEECPPPNPPPPPFERSVLIIEKAFMANTILPRNTAFTATKAMIPKKSGMRAASFIFKRRRRGRSFLICFFFFLPRPGVIESYANSLLRNMTYQIFLIIRQSNGMTLIRSFVKYLKMFVICNLRIFCSLLDK